MDFLHLLGIIIITASLAGALGFFIGMVANATDEHKEA